MYPCSERFHEATQEPKTPQKVLLIFSDAVFTDDDIDVDAGLEFDDNFNMESDLAIGQRTSNEIRFTMFNDDRLLNDYEFGEFTATIGVRTGEGINDKGLSLYYGGNLWTGSGKTRHRLMKNGSDTFDQPPFPVVSMLAAFGKVYCFSTDGECFTVSEETGHAVAFSANAFVRNKAKGWEGRTFSYEKRIPSEVHSSYILTIRGTDRSMETYEFVPLGVFTVERPNVPDQIRIDMTGHDRMMKFEEDMPELSYPTTMYGLMSQLCTEFGVPTEITAETLLNGDISVPEAPEGFRNTTARTVIGWIAEAAGSNARIDRDGYLRMEWVRSTTQSFTEGWYTDYSPYWYETPKVTTLYNRASVTGEDVVVGEGDQGYLIQDNPFLAVDA